MRHPAPPSMTWKVNGGITMISMLPQKFAFSKLTLLPSIFGPFLPNHLGYNTHFLIEVTQTSPLRAVRVQAPSTAKDRKCLSSEFLAKSNGKTSMFQLSNLEKEIWDCLHGSLNKNWLQFEMLQAYVWKYIEIETFFKNLISYQCWWMPLTSWTAD